MPISLSISGTGFDPILSYLDDLAYRVFDLRPLAEKISDEVEIQNMAARMLGVDTYGDDFQPLSPNTWKRHPNRGPGPPLAGHEMSSRIISGLEMRIEQDGPTDFTVVGSWPSMPWLKYHVTGTQHMPSRDPVGITAAGMDAIERAFDDHLEAILGGVY